MEYILSSAEMKDCDEKTTSQYGIPAMILMERAALETAKLIMEEYGTDIFVGIVAGSGNNGGDGIAIARILKEYGVAVEILMAGNCDHLTELTRMQMEIATKLEIPVRYLFDNFCYDVIVDALLGVGLSRNVEGNYKKVIDLINESGAKVVAVDITSGVDASTGAILGSAVKADITVTYGFKKFGHVMYPGTSHCGTVLCVTIGIPHELALQQRNKAIIFDEYDLQLPYRTPSGNKGSFGKVFLIAGSKNMGGACQLAATSAFRIGAGMVKIFTSVYNKDSLLRKVPEAMISCYEEGDSRLTTEDKDAIERGMEWADVVAIGPGISISEKATAILTYLLRINTKSLVMDADALNILAEQPQLMKFFEANGTDPKFETIMTPHLGEFARMIKHPIAEIKNNLIAYARSFTHKYQVTLVCKDARTIVTKGGCVHYINTSGNSGMATAGAGDVLTGMIAGLLAQGMEAHEAAVMGTFAHGRAGDIAKSNTSAYYIMSQDIIQAIRYL